jgi:transketolase
MRKEFASFLFEEMINNKKIVVITADIGYGILDKLRESFPDRVINVGSCEMLMIGVAIGYCYEGFIPICYTITPFLLYRPFEMLRNYINHENLNIKLVGSGRDKDYSHDGITHWAEDDLIVIHNCLPNFITYKPEILTKYILIDILSNDKPCYLNLKRNY